MGRTPEAGVVDTLLAWYLGAARDLPWRVPGVGAWAVLVCEVMSQQTPVARVVPRWRAWLERWPTPTALADSPAGDAVRMWDRLGYPRRALRLHEAATVVRDQHEGAVPVGYEQLLALPGVGPYTAAATAAFAQGERVVVLDVNIRRVLARVHDGRDARPGAPTRGEVDRAERLLPADAARSVRWNAALMELGALVCTARSPGCHMCPLRPGCAWAAAPPADSGVRPPRTTRPQAWVGTDRYVRGLLLAVLRDPGSTDRTDSHRSDGSVGADRLMQVWDDEVQTARCLAGLLTDGLVEPAPDGYRLPT